LRACKRRKGGAERKETGRGAHPGKKNFLLKKKGISPVRVIEVGEFQGEENR